MTARSEYDAAYFTLLRAREEHRDLLRYREYLEREEQRLESFSQTTREGAAELPRKVRKAVDQTEKGVLEAVGRRRAAVLRELSRMDDRVGNAQAFIDECEAEVASLRR